MKIKRRETAIKFEMYYISIASRKLISSWIRVDGKGFIDLPQEYDRLINYYTVLLL
jgi:hypothetical protein